jgi:hypothetical protein
MLGRQIDDLVHRQEISADVGGDRIVAGQCRTDRDPGLALFIRHIEYPCGAVFLGKPGRRAEMPLKSSTPAP